MSAAEVAELPPGLHRQERDEYDRVRRVHFSALKWIGRSPMHYRYQVDHERERAKLARFGVVDSDDTSAMQRGRVVGMAVFEPEIFKAKVVVFDGVKNGKTWEAFLDRHPDAEIVKPAAYDHALKMGKIVRTHPQSAPLLNVTGQAEVTVIWEHEVPAAATLPAWSLPLKGRLDFLSFETGIHDLKSVTSADLRDFGAAAFRYGWHAQGAMYVDGVLKSTGRRLRYFLHALEAEPPHALQVYELADEELEIGRDTYRAWLDTLHHCHTTGHWPSYAEAPMRLTLPRFAYPSDD